MFEIYLLMIVHYLDTTSEDFAKRWIAKYRQQMATIDNLYDEAKEMIRVTTEELKHMLPVSWMVERQIEF